MANENNALVMEIRIMELVINPIFAYPSGPWP
jgi:hypothetical protein